MSGNPTGTLCARDGALPPAEPPAIRVEGLVTRFGGHLVHEDAGLDVRRGEVLGVVGASGSGKSVLLKVIVGLLRPTTGRIVVLGHDVGTLDPQRRIALQARCGVLFQDGALFSSLTVAENVKVPLVEHTRLPAALVDEIVRVKIAMVGLPADAAHKFPSQLSGGMRKRAGLARALALDPEILFLDEPTAGLDPIGAAAFDRLIRHLQQGLGLTVFMVTHDLDSLSAICDRIAVLIDRKLLVGTLETLQRETHPWIRAYFGGPRGRAALGAEE
jgi:phospholipid/cholesterol/gamma-HCH transport system ATP-binding protein